MKCSVACDLIAHYLEKADFKFDLDVDAYEAIGKLAEVAEYCEMLEAFGMLEEEIK